MPGAPSTVQTLAGYRVMPGISPALKWHGHTYTSLKAMHPSKREFLVDKLIWKRSLGALVADSGIGKTPWLYQLGLCVASGTPFLGHKVEQGTVLYVDYEDSLDQIITLEEDLGKHLGLPSKISDDFIVWSIHTSGPAWSPTKLPDMVADYNPSLVIVDTLSSMYPAVEKSNTDANQILAELRSITTRSSCALMFSHHRRKSGKDVFGGSTALKLDKIANARDWFGESRGPGSIIARVDVRIGLDDGEFGDADICLVQRGYSRLRNEVPHLYLKRVYDTDEPLGYERVVGSGLLGPYGEPVYAALPPEFTFSEAVKAYKLSDNPTRQFLKRCIDLGILEQPVKRGPYKKVPIL